MEETLGRTSEELVAGGMPEGVVDVLEAVDVEVEQDELAAVTGHPLAGLGEGRLEVGAVRQPRHAVHGRQGVETGLGGVALHGVAHRTAHHHLVGLTLYQVVLRSEAQAGLGGLERDHAGQHDDGRTGVEGAEPPHGVGTDAVGELVIQQDDVDLPIPQALHRLVQRSDVVHLDGGTDPLAQQMPHHGGVGGVVFDEQDAKRHADGLLPSSSVRVGGAFRRRSSAC